MFAIPYRDLCLAPFFIFLFLPCAKPPPCRCYAVRTDIPTIGSPGRLLALLTYLGYIPRLLAATYRDVVSPMGLAAGGEEGTDRLCLWVWGLADACDAVDLVEISDKEERHGTERHCQNGRHRHPFRRHQTRLPHLAAALPWAGWAWQTSQTRSFRDIAAISP
ncbi:hypothetical protein LZ31DRAFT_300499 [Colletotrichum somersetense]|nr:hypothetical protein LZ31DRAFT_300499 [Colletotrichum somersetense]